MANAWSTNLRKHELFGPLIDDKLIYYPTVTREPFRNRGRITDLIASNQLFADIGLSGLDIETDRVMLCGSPGDAGRTPRDVHVRAALSRAITVSPDTS